MSVPSLSFHATSGELEVSPYAHEYTAFCKQRWIGRTILEVMAGEFASHTRGYFARAITAGAVTVNGRVVSPSHVLRDGAKIVHALHRHEPPVPAAAAAPMVLSDADGLIALSKPGGISVHPAGAHHHLTVVELFARKEAEASSGGGQRGAPLHVIHRIDRVTSGVLLLARSRARAQAVSAALQNEPGAAKVRKRYVALVAGVFPEMPGGGEGNDFELTPFFSEVLAGGGAPPPPLLHLTPLAHVPFDGALPSTSPPPCPWLASFVPSAVRAFADDDAPPQAAISEDESETVVVSVATVATVAATKMRVVGGGGKKRPRTDDVMNETVAAAAAAANPSIGVEGGIIVTDSALPRAAPELIWLRHGYLRVSAPITTTDAKNAIQGIAAVGAIGGSSVTLFRRIRVVNNGSATLIEALPLTGRSHQIRVHLALLGHPIVDDNVYCATAAAALTARANLERGVLSSSSSPPPSSSSSSSSSSFPLPLSPSIGSLPPIGDAREATLKALCRACRSGVGAAFSPSQMFVRAISLHSAEYEAVPTVAVGVAITTTGVTGGGEEKKPGGGGGAALTAAGRESWRFAAPLPSWVNNAMSGGR